MKRAAPRVGDGERHELTGRTWPITVEAGEK